ncbi:MULTISPECIES: hypothetical protein [Mycolicibacterium]|uniref:hypothetical protein n=1 Tax=Mycolicibacterium TaxID=1866885 RepID=UPI000CF848ED|nr:hypothetical protein [Mycolicibacterium austroafricanum]PQP41784.1 hypothetical protein C6A88_27645 [Mycolicibacterium austroafricanum]
MPADLRTICGVELVKVGTWQPGGTVGDWTVTAEHLAAAIDAHRAGVLRKPVVKIGHDDPRFDGGPALGYVDGLRLADGGSTLVGDLVNVPAPVAKLLPHAYPDRSIEALVDFTDQAGKSWPLVLTGLALLGAADPAVETLRSLQDVGALYGIDVAAKRIVLATNHGAGGGRRRAVAVAAARRRRTHRLTTERTPS